MGELPSDLDRRWVRASFDRAAAGYDAVADFQRDVADRLLERLEYIRIDPGRVADIGAGTGYGARGLAARYRRASVLAVDISLAMLGQARRQAPRLFSRQRFLCSDARSLALAGDSCDLLFSSLALQWCTDLEATFAELWRVCAPGGLLLFATLGPDTLRELRESWAAVDGRVHVNQFHDMHVVGDSLVRAGFHDVVMDVDRLSRRYPDVTTLMRHLKALGAHNVSAARPRHLVGRRALEELRRAYEAYRKDGHLPTTYEVVFGHAWKAAAPGSTAVEVPLIWPSQRRSNGQRGLLP